MFLAASIASAQLATKQAREELLKVNKEYDDALLRGDTKALERIFASTAMLG
jgi:hypothetical protein